VASALSCEGGIMVGIQDSLLQSFIPRDVDKSPELNDSISLLEVGGVCLQAIRNFVIEFGARYCTSRC
jgi:hypothetical protein